ncbi:MAG TPA: LamG-like jellyroll fold domain-containing protein, partial [Terriglobales bacterium]
MTLRRSAIAFRFIAVLVALLASAHAQNRPEPLTYVEPPQYGPYNGVFLAGGDGLNKTVAEKDPVLKADAPWTLFAWVNADDTGGTRYIAGIGDPSEEYSRYLVLRDGAPGIAFGKDNALFAKTTVPAHEWHALAATFDGSEIRIYRDGAEVANGRLPLGSVSAVAKLAPPAVERHFGGRIAHFAIERRALTAAEVAQLSQQRPEFSLINFEEGSRRWPLQTRQQAGYIAPQDPATLPQSKAPFTKPVAKPIPNVPALPQGATDNEWVLAGGWKLIEAPKVNATPEEISRAGLRTNDWMAATVPGTVLTTMIDRGIYPDPDYGLNNLAIPESLNKQDYWYRNEFRAPAALNGRRLALTFQGINYHADVWMNGKRLGDVTGAFIRGVFDVTEELKPNAMNVLAVRISPPPHPGIPQEQSIKGGPGENGGAMVIDGPTFMATEGWDWIPAIRDRNSGIWQPVTLTATDVLKIGDAQVVSTLPLPDNSRATLDITVPVENASNAPVAATLTASFEQTTVTKTASVPPGKSQIRLTAQEFPQLNVQHPRLWWPNGYGKPELYDLQLTLAQNNRVSDRKNVRFGIREISYELSLFDSAGNLRRVEYRPTLVRGHNTEVVDITHEGMRSIPANDPFPPEYPKEWKEGWRSWVASLARGGENSPAVRSVPAAEATPAPYLVVKVNGVRIAARGGNWGMDDSRKRVSREHLEPYFRLHRDANLNIIRNWVGQDTEENFYDLADEYGMMVWNDFWESTQDYNAEAQDPVLFLDNAHDTILRFRNHPSIIMWCGRNEGVPQPIINRGLADIISKFDGTRYYSPSSNQVNLQNSGPYHYQDPTLYFTTLNHGFSVETGTPSFSTLEAFRASIAPPDQWPLSDAWAYHDWHQSGNGDVATFMTELQNEFGAPTSLEDFERKAQMLNYVSHR